MRPLRLIYAWCFAVVAASCVVWSGAVLLIALGVLQRPAELTFPADAPAVLLPLLIAAPFGFAAFAVLRNKSYARKPATLACMVLVVFYVLTFGHRPLQILNPWLISALTGILGIVAFSARGDAEKPARAARAYRRIPGDGTNPITNKLILIGGIAGGLGGVRLVAMLALRRGLPHGFPPFFVLQVLLAILLVLAIHEAGHAVGGVLVRMKLIGFVVGPLQWYREYGRLTFTFRTARLLAFVGQTMVAPATLQNFRNRKAVQVAAGPAASLLAGAAAIAAISVARGKPWAIEWGILAVFATITTLVGLFNLVPFGSKAMYSDGAKLYQLLSGGLWSDYHRALAMTSSILITPTRPRDYDIDTFERAAGTIAQGTDELFVRLCAYAYYRDAGRDAEAAAAMERVENCCREWALEPPAEWMPIFVYGHAAIRQDAAAARSWWNRMEARKGYRFTENMWSARGALALAEGRMDDAADALAHAEAWVAPLPRLGVVDTERDSIRRLRRMLDEASAERAVQVALPAK